VALDDAPIEQDALPLNTHFSGSVSTAERVDGAHG
jgi:hypothetical protein